MKCKFLKPNQEACKANAMKGSELCFLHNPATKESARLAQIKGARSPKPRAVAQLSSEDVRTAFILAEAVLPAIQRSFEEIRKAIGYQGATRGFWGKSGGTRGNY
jgi:hypothetical protein